MKYGSVEEIHSNPSGTRRAIWCGLLASSAAILVVLASWNSVSGQSVLFQNIDVNRAEQAVAVAQAKVERDLRQAARLRQATSLTTISGDWLANGPRAKSPLPPPTDNEKEVLQNPDSMYQQTPRIKRKNMFGPNARHCPGGNCENIYAAGVAADRWPTDIYTGIPLTFADPDASPERNRAINQRVGQFARHLHPENYHAPVQWGIGAAPGENPDGYDGEGTVAKADRGVAVLEANGVNHDNWPADIYSGFPWPSFDETQFDQKLHKDKLPSADPLQSIASIRSSDEALRNAGVTVNHLPGEDVEHEFNSVDGMADKLVSAPQVPQWNKGGVAPQDMPASFLLREHPDMAGPQPQLDPDLGVEVEPGMANARNFFDSLGCGQNGCFGARDGQEAQSPE